MACYAIDGVPLDPQPDQHEWQPEIEGVLGYDGDGMPIKQKYRWCKLRVANAVRFQDWEDHDDGAAHTVTVPAPAKRGGNFTDYAGCWIVVSYGEVQAAGAITDLKMLIMGAQAF